MTRGTTLNERTIRSLLPKAPDTVELADAETKGLALRGNQRSAKWVLRRTIRGQRTRITLGEWPALKAAEARRIAQEALAATSLGGVDALEQYRPPKGKTLYEVLTKWKDTHSHLRQTENRFNRAIKFWESLLHRDALTLDDKDYIEVVDMNRPHRPTATVSVAKDMRAILRWAAERELVPDGTLQRFKPGTYKTRDHVPTVNECRIAWQALEELNFCATPLFKFLMLTAFRIGEVRSVQFDWVDFHEGTITIPEHVAKTKANIIHPLSGTALNLIREQRMRNTGPYAFVRDNGEPFYQVGYHYRVWMEQCEAIYAEFRRFTCHDVRRAMASNMADTGWDAHAIELALSHSPRTILGVVGSIYNRSQRMKDRRLLMDQWAATVKTRDIATLAAE